MSNFNWLYGYHYELEHMFSYARTTPGFRFEVGGKPIDPEAYIMNSSAYNATWNEENMLFKGNLSRLFDHICDELKKQGVEIGLVYKDDHTDSSVTVAYFHGPYFGEAGPEDAEARLEKELGGRPRPKVTYNLIRRRFGYPEGHAPQWYPEYDGSRGRSIVIRRDVGVLWSSRCSQYSCPWLQDLPKIFKDTPNEEEEEQDPGL